jgi:hypothetical protein
MRPKRRNRLLESDDRSPSPVHVSCLGDLRLFLGKSSRNAAAVHATDFEGDHLSSASSQVLKQPVRPFFPLHSPDNAPSAVLMNNGERHSFRSVLRNPIVIMLVDLSEVGCRPRQRTVRNCWHQVKRQTSP